MKWGEVTVETELVPGTFVAWFQIGPMRGPDDEYWVAVLMADLVEQCGVKYIGIEDFILRGGQGGMRGMSSDRDGLSAVRITSCFETVLRERRLVRFNGIRGGTECKGTQRVGQRLGSRSGARVWYQQPSVAKSAFTDERLRRAGLWVIGHEHARDAMRHLCVLQRTLEKTDLRDEDWRSAADKELSGEKPKVSGERG